MEHKKPIPLVSNDLNDEQLEQAAGGALIDHGEGQWKYTCRACGHWGLTSRVPNTCSKCMSTNITSVKC